MPSYFSRKLFKFLIELAHNNDRAWFQANKERYEKEVRDPLLAFITDFQKPLSRVSASFVADPRPSGGSLFRIHRDVRFAKDKSPYKTHAAAHFRHARGKDVHAPGFYLHLEPGSVFLGSGLWRPEPETLLAIRRAISERPKDWTHALSGKSFNAKAKLEGELLARPPKGFAADHPQIEHLRRKDFVAITRFSEKEACQDGFMKMVTDGCRAHAPFMAFLTHAVGLEW